MPAAVATSEPTTITAGDTLTWLRTLPDHPATLWVLKYALQLQGQPLIPITASASGTAHLISVAAAVSGNYAPGAWTCTPYVESIAQPIERHTLPAQLLQILPSPLAALGASHASRMLGLIEAALENRIPAGLETTNIDGQELARIPLADLSRLQEKYQQKVAAETLAARSRAGLRANRTIGMRFVKA